MDSNKLVEFCTHQNKLLDAEINELSTKILKKEIEIKSINDNIIQKKAIINDEIKILKDEIKAIENEIDDTLVRINENNKEILLRRISGKEKVIIQLRNIIEKKHNEIQDIITSIKNEIDDLNKRINTKENQKHENVELIKRELEKCTKDSGQATPTTSSSSCLTCSILRNKNTSLLSDSSSSSSSGSIVSCCFSDINLSDFDFLIEIYTNQIN